VRFELDHVFLAVSNGAPETDALIGAGFTEGAPNSHPGQGTACRRIFFSNAYLELIWLEDLAEASSPLVEPTALALRAACTEGVSRVGLCLRAIESGETLPIDTWRYRPPYLPEGTFLPVAASSRVLHEPLLFFLPGGIGRPKDEQAHPNGARALTAVTVTVPKSRPWSAELEWLAHSGCVLVESGERELLRIDVDRDMGRGSVRLNPSIPLQVNW
jgi:hypothetical protein